MNSQDQNTGIKDLIRVALLVGGDSSEREVSFKTSCAMHSALSPEHFDVTVFDVSTYNEPLQWDASRLSTSEIETLTNWWNSDLSKRHLVKWNDLAKELAGNFDVVLPGLHGGWGEDGTLQALLDVAGIPYVGSPQKACAIAMDKVLTKAIARDLEVQTPRGVLLNEATKSAPFLPCVVKPNGGGSSVGVTIVRDENIWSGAFSLALADTGSVLVEEVIEGIEVTAAIIGQKENARALPLVEITPQSDGGFYDFEAKYAAGGSDHVVPARLDEAVTKQIQNAALTVHRALGCDGVSRSDFLVTPGGAAYFLEINTLPGMTSTSLVPDAAKSVGMSFSELIETLLCDALSRK